MADVTIDEDRARHIFRSAEGHFAEDNAANRQALMDAVGRQENFLGTDRFGNAWWVEQRADGTQVWVQLRDRRIMNGGVNLVPRRFDLSGIPAPSTSEPRR